MSTSSSQDLGLTLEAFVDKYPKLKPGFSGIASRGSFLGVPDFELGESEESKSEEPVAALNLLGVIKTLYGHLDKRWPSPDGIKYISREEEICLNELGRVKNLNSYVHGVSDFLKIMDDFRFTRFVTCRTSQEFLYDLQDKLESLILAIRFDEVVELSRFLDRIRYSRFLEFFLESHQELYSQANVSTQLKIVAKVARLSQSLCANLLSQINFSAPMFDVTSGDIELLLNNLGIRDRLERNSDVWTFRLHEVGECYWDMDDETYLPERLFFALRLPVIGIVAAETVAEFAKHKKTICESIKSISPLSAQIQVLHALIYEKGSIGYEGIRVKRGWGPFSNACSFFGGQLGVVFTAYQKSIKKLTESESLPVLQDTLRRFQESGMSPIPEALIQKVRALSTAASASASPSPSLE